MTGTKTYSIWKVHRSFSQSSFLKKCDRQFYSLTVFIENFNMFEIIKNITVFSNVIQSTKEFIKLYNKKTS
jgi:hypothetical protein